MYEERYRRQKEELLNSPTINPKNIKVIKKFLELREYRLKRKEGLSEVDERSYKTLTGFVTRIKNINTWLKNKTWRDLTKKEIKKLIDDLEDGVIKTSKGKRFVDRSLYYQMLRGTFFKLVKKNQIAIDILDDFGITGRRDTNEVKFFTEATFRSIVRCSNNVIHLALMWLAWDIGENINTLLALTKEDFRESINEDTKEPEFLVTLSKEKLKRSRTPRTLITNYPETHQYLKLVINNLSETQKHYYEKGDRKKLSDLHSANKLFKFQIESSRKFLEKYTKLSNAKCERGEKVCWKDFRSSMACNLLTKDWTIDEVKSRLGHRPSSRMIDKYVDYLAIGTKIKRASTKVYQSNLKKLEAEIEEQKERNKLQSMKFKKLDDRMKKMNELLFLMGENITDDDLDSEKHGYVEVPTVFVKN